MKKNGYKVALGDKFPGTPSNFKIYKVQMSFSEMCWSVHGHLG